MEKMEAKLLRMTLSEGEDCHLKMPSGAYRHVECLGGQNFKCLETGDSVRLTQDQVENDLYIFARVA